MANIFFDDPPLNEGEIILDEIERSHFRNECVKDFEQRKRKLKTWSKPVNDDW